MVEVRRYMSTGMTRLVTISNWIRTRKYRKMIKSRIVPYTVMQIYDVHIWQIPAFGFISCAIQAKEWCVYKIRSCPWANKLIESIERLLYFRQGCKPYVSFRKTKLSGMRHTECLGIWSSMHWVVFLRDSQEVSRYSRRAIGWSTFSKSADRKVYAMFFVFRHGSERNMADKWEGHLTSLKKDFSVSSFYLFWGHWTVVWAYLRRMKVDGLGGDQYRYLYQIVMWMESAVLSACLGGAICWVLVVRDLGFDYSKALRFFFADLAFH